MAKRLKRTGKDHQNIKKFTQKLHAIAVEGCVQAAQSTAFYFQQDMLAVDGPSVKGQFLAEDTVLLIDSITFTRSENGAAAGSYTPYGASWYLNWWADGGPDGENPRLTLQDSWNLHKEQIANEAKLAMESLK